MDTPHLSFEISFSALDPFLDHWASRYSDSERDERLYDPYIRKADLRTDLEALKALFTWKNGGDRISELKLASIRTNYFDHWSQDNDLESRYLDHNNGGGPIWNIFYLHCRQPDRYRRAQKTEGGIYSLSEVLLEQMRRKLGIFGGREGAAKIIEMAGRSADGFVTYLELWKAFRPDVTWEAYKSLRPISDSLDRVIHYCVTNRLPILTVLVVRTDNRRLSSQAVKNIFNSCRELGVDVGFDPKEFVDKQIELSRAVVVEELPEESTS
jgi:hypothetical protein